MTKVNCDIYASNILQEKGWVSINDGYIYIARNKTRSYWVLSNIRPKKRPIIRFNDKNQTIYIGRNKIVITYSRIYKQSKNNLQPYSRKI